MDETGDESRFDSLIQQIKSAPRAGQFRLGRLLAVVIAVALLLTLPRLWGWSYARFFVLLYMLTYGFAPFVSWVLFCLLPKPLGNVRWIASGVFFALVAIALPVLVGLEDGLIGSMATLGIGVLIFWLPQSAIMLGLWWSFFRKAPRHASTTMVPNPEPKSP